MENAYFIGYDGDVPDTSFLTSEPLFNKDESKNSIFPKVILVPFSDEKYSNLLNRLHLDKKKLGSSEFQQIFVNAIYLFLKGEWSLDDLSALAKATNDSVAFETIGFVPRR